MPSLWVGWASQMFWHLGDVTVVAAPGLHRHLPSTSDLGVNDFCKIMTVCSLLTANNYITNQQKHI